MVQFRYIAAFFVLSSVLPAMGQSGEVGMLADYGNSGFPSDPTRLIVICSIVASHCVAAVFFLRYIFLRVRPAWVGPAAETLKNRPIWLACILAIATALAGPTVCTLIYFCFSGGKISGSLLLAIGVFLWLWFLFKSPSQKTSKADKKPLDV